MNNKGLTYLWCMLLLLSAVYIIKYAQFETNILKLLPKYESKLTESLIEKASEKINNKLLIVVAGQSQELSRKNFLQQTERYQKSGLFKDIKTTIAIDQYQQLYQYLIQYQYSMMTIDDQLAITKYKDDNYFIDLAIAELYGLLRNDGQQIKKDPLFFFSRFINQLLLYKNTEIATDDGLFYRYKNDIHHYFAFAELQQSAYSPSYQQQISALIKESQQMHKTDSTTYAFGTVLYAHEAYQQAKTEISTVGAGSLLGIILLFIVVFRSITPLIISVTCIALGLTFALAITTMVFTKVHLFALVFGSTIAGVSIDYCFHYLCASTADRTKEKVIRHIAPGLVIGFLSSAMVYTGFIITGYEVLAQISLFSVCCLGAVLINVMLLFPVMIKRNVHNFGFKQSKITQLLLKNPLAIIFDSLTKTLILFFIVLATNYLVLSPNDDVRALQSLSSDLKDQERYIRDVMGIKPDGRYALVYASSRDELLTREHQIIKQLRTKQPAIIGISDLIAPKEQRLLLQNFYRKLYQSDAFKDYITMNGLDRDIVEFHNQQTLNIHRIDDHFFQHKTIQNLLAEKWIGQINGHYALAIALNEDIDTSQYPLLNNRSGVVVVQQAEDASILFAEFRQKSLIIVVVSALLLIVFLGTFRYGFSQAVHVVALPFFTGLLALLVTQLLGYHVSLFSILALFLILGMGLDYVVFLQESLKKEQVMFALMLSSITTVLSFGLLSLSGVAVIKSFGFTVAIGILLILLIAPAIIKQKKTS